MSIQRTMLYSVALLVCGGAFALSGWGQVTTGLATAKVNTVLYADQYCTTAGTYDQSCFNNAIAALPSCSISNFYSPITFSYTPPLNYSHCGTIIGGAHTYAFTSGVSVTSPFVKIQGDSPSATTVEWTGSSGAAFSFTASPYNFDATSTGGLFDVAIDGKGGSAGTFGLETYDIGGFNAARLSITNFTGAGSVGWLDTNVSDWCEKFHVDISLSNNKVGWELLAAQDLASFGYGVFDVKAVVFSGQTGVLVNGGGFSDHPGLANSMLHLTINQVQSGGTGLEIENDGALAWNTYAVHIEAPNGGTELSMDSTSTFTGSGQYSDDGSSYESLAAGSTFQMTYSNGEVRYDNTQFGGLDLYNPQAATSGASYSTPGVAVGANGWNGSASTDYFWLMQGSTNASGTQTYTRLSIFPNVIPSGITNLQLDLVGTQLSFGNPLNSSGIN
ncbi:MAG: hypothetical protein WBX18_13815, partial [Terracidiphilus sp.]